MKNITNHNGDIVIYQSEDGNTRINVNLQGETVWLSANQMAILFDRDEKTIRKHINNALNNELSEGVDVTKIERITNTQSVVANFSPTAKDGKNIK